MAGLALRLFCCFAWRGVSAGRHVADRLFSASVSGLILIVVVCFPSVFTVSGGCSLNAFACQASAVV